MVNFASNAVSALILCGISEGVGAFISLNSPLQHASLLSMVRFRLRFLPLQVEPQNELKPSSKFPY
jgi:hypothetical protein